LSLRGIPMAKLIYAALASLDGYVADEAGKFDWAVPVKGRGSTPVLHRILEVFGATFLG
jgi:hypothetical protein